MTNQDLSPRLRSKLSIINGGKEERENLFRRLWDSPHAFEQAEFEHLIDHTFHKDLNYDEKARIIERRIGLREGDALERQAVLALLNGDCDELERLEGVLARRNALGLRVISSGSDPESPPQLS